MSATPHTSAENVLPLPAVELVALQQRTLRVLFTAAVPAGAATTAAFSSAALLGKDLTGNGFLGTLAAASFTIGGALATVPLAGYMSTHGRRAGMRLGWGVALAGAVLAISAAWLEFYPLLLLGGLGAGFGNATNLSARYAAADLAEEDQRARSIGVLVWAGSFGSVLGPTIGLSWAGTAADWVGIPELAGPYVISAILFAVAAVWIDRRLRPDPLQVARNERAVTEDAPLVQAAPAHRAVRSTATTLGAIVRNADARLAASAMLVGHAVMVGIMTATPLHMDDGAHELRIVGFVISLHIVGMYFFAPIVGWLVDRAGTRTVIALGGVTLFIGAELAAHTHAEDSMGVFTGLFLVGLGWSFGLIAGSSLLTASFGVDERVQVQGAADLLMTGAGALAALTGGVVYEVASYHSLSHYAGLVAAAMSAAAVWSWGRMRRQVDATAVG